MGWSINYKEIGVRRNYEEEALGTGTPLAESFLISSRGTGGPWETS